MKVSMAPLEFFLDALDRFRRAHSGESPWRLVLSPESYRELAAEKEIQKHLILQGSFQSHNPTFVGVEIFTQHGELPHFVANDGSIEFL